MCVFNYVCASWSGLFKFLRRVGKLAPVMDDEADNASCHCRRVHTHTQKWTKTQKRNETGCRNKLPHKPCGLKHGLMDCKQWLHVKPQAVHETLWKLSQGLSRWSPVLPRKLTSVAHYAHNHIHMMIRSLPCKLKDAATAQELCKKTKHNNNFRAQKNEVNAARNFHLVKFK